jgi:tagatose 6-phosphate kinase
MAGPRFFAVGLSPALSRVVRIPSLRAESVIRAIDYIEAAAGKAANSCRVASQLGASPLLLSPLGDESLDYYRQMTEADGIRLDAVPYPGRTRWAVTLIDQEKVEKGQEAATELIIGEANPVPAWLGKELLERGLGHLASSDLCLIAGSRPRTIGRQVLESIARRAAELGVPLFLDMTGGDMLAVLDAVAEGKEERSREKDSRVVVKVNGKEFEESFGTRPDAKGALAIEARRRGCSFVVTRGAKSVLSYDLRKERGGELPVATSLPMNPIGSGDTFLAALALSLTTGADFPSAVAHAAEMASLNTRFLRPGTIVAP